MLKRIFDLLSASTGLLILSPVMLVIAIMIAMIMGRPVIFKQTRPGLNGQLFNMYKFRTMYDDRDSNGNELSDKERLTKFGMILRKSSLDELPELWNVVKGDMSIVGPRPLLPEYLPLYSDEQARRHNVRPGITGWAQINGRNSINWNEKFAHDIWYVDNQSFMLDFKIILLTIKKVLIKEGINHDGEATMSRFTGNDN